ncbi:DinB family protein [Planctomycetaceae bacterium]|jgi:hypothetical protein|nr:DinB family protein [Planctomycetaceae bacterium]MDC0262358.1 DinB family protein [Planctomycetaceae bacterium]MDC0307793.1 DinB family protein [Planctomycetaceae bacterium]MDG2389794.1 DinB family protein [Planctomycetaceae bacterium]
MHARDVLIGTVEMGNKMLLPMFQDLQDAQLEGTLPNGGNSAHWILGHLIVSEAQMCRGFAMGQESPYEKWNALFKGGSTPDPAGKDYPSYEELMKILIEERANTVSILQGISEEDLEAKPAIVMEGYEEFFPNKAAVFIVNTNHPFMHYGQLADIRRRLGRDILMG